MLIAIAIIVLVLLVILTRPDEVVATEGNFAIIIVSKLATMIFSLFKSIRWLPALFFTLILATIVNAVNLLFIWLTPSFGTVRSKGK